MSKMLNEKKPTVTDFTNTDKNEEKESNKSKTYTIITNSQYRLQATTSDEKISLTLFEKDKFSSSFFSPIFREKETVVISNPNSASKIQLKINQNDQENEKITFTSNNSYELRDLKKELDIATNHTMVSLQIYLNKRLKENSSTGWTDTPEIRFNKLKLADTFLQCLQAPSLSREKARAITAEIYELGAKQDKKEGLGGELGNIIHNYRYKIDPKFRESQPSPAILVIV